MKNSNQISENLKSPIELMNAKILTKTMWIRNNEPELSKYLNEMPVTIPTGENPAINLKNLSDYLDSLNQMVKNYSNDKVLSLKTTSYSVDEKK